MYFIAAGAVEIELPDGKTRLEAGHFFGEIAVLRRARRSATVRAVERTRLLVLAADDFRALTSKQPDIAARLRDVVEERVGRELITPEGDLVTEKIDEDETDDSKRAGTPQVEMGETTSSPSSGSRPPCRGNPW